MDLTLTPTSRQPGSDLKYVITEMPGWKDADETVQQRVLAAAERYLIVGKTSVGEWIGKVPMTLFRNDTAAVRAFILLKQEAPEVYDTIPAAAWQTWAPAIVALPRSTGTERSPAVADVLTDALAASPTEFVETVRTIVRAERDRTRPVAGSVRTSFYWRTSARPSRSRTEPMAARGSCRMMALRSGVV